MKYRNGPGVGLLAGDVAGIHRKEWPDLEGWYYCRDCNEIISSDEPFCIACLVKERDSFTAVEDCVDSFRAKNKTAPKH